MIIIWYEDDLFRPHTYRNLLLRKAVWIIQSVYIGTLEPIPSHHEKVDLLKFVVGVETFWSILCVYICDIFYHEVLELKSLESRWCYDLSKMQWIQNRSNIYNYHYTQLDPLRDCAYAVAVVQCIEWIVDLILFFLNICSYLQQWQQWLRRKLRCNTKPSKPNLIQHFNRMKLLMWRGWREKSWGVGPSSCRKMMWMMQKDFVRTLNTHCSHCRELARELNTVQ